MLKKRTAVILLVLAILSNLTACKSNTDEKENIEPAQTKSVDAQGDVLNTGGNFNKILVSNAENTVDKNDSESSELQNSESSESAEGSELKEQTGQSSRPPIGLAVKDSEYMIDIEEEKVIGTIDYDTLDITGFNDCDSVDLVNDTSRLTDSVQTILHKFDMEQWSKIVGYLTDICERYHIDISTVESARGRKVDESLTYKIIVAHNDKYNIYLAINKEDYTAKFSVKEK